MRVLVVGGSGSGKSRYAEGAAVALGTRRTYVATMRPGGPEAQARIARHWAQRAGLGFRTLECVGSLRPALPADDDGVGASGRPQDGGLGADSVVLVDDLGNLCADALFLPDGTMDEPDAVLGRLDRELEALCESYGSSVLVADLVGGEGRGAYESTHAWVRLVGALCCRMAARADSVVEVCAGVPCAVKGVLPWAC